MEKGRLDWLKTNPDVHVRRRDFKPFTSQSVEMMFSVKDQDTLIEHSVNSNKTVRCMLCTRTNQ